MNIIAIASSDRKFARELRLQLVGWGYRPWSADPEEPLLTQLQERGADLMLLDFAEPIGDAAKTARALKAAPETKHTPILAFIEARETSLLDFSIGLDDFWIKSNSFEKSGFDAGFDELHARIRFVLWRLSKLDSDDVIRAGDLTINLASYQVAVGGESIYLTYKEFELLRFLMTHRGRVFSRDGLLRHVWGEEYLGGTRTVDVHIRRLRAKIGPQFDELIQTVRNVGYKMIKESKE
jgi:DNA-binding response OmpR family regulator